MVPRPAVALPGRGSGVPVLTNRGARLEEAFLLGHFFARAVLGRPTSDVYSRSWIPNVGILRRNCARRDRSSTASTQGIAVGQSAHDVALGFLPFRM